MHESMALGMIMNVVLYHVSLYTARAHGGGGSV